MSTLTRSTKPSPGAIACNRWSACALNTPYSDAFAVGSGVAGRQASVTSGRTLRRTQASSEERWLVRCELWRRRMPEPNLELRSRSMRALCEPCVAVVRPLHIDSRGHVWVARGLTRCVNRSAGIATTRCARAPHQSALVNFCKPETLTRVKPVTSGLVARVTRLAVQSFRLPSRTTCLHELRSGLAGWR
jgi:hypothetical protein